jgi:UDP-N-acetylmuramate dehydrogenase
MIMWDRELKQEIQQSIGGRILFDVPMGGHTSLKIGGPADALAFPQDAEDLESLMKTARQRGIPHLVAGQGTNLLVLDRGIRGLVVNLSAGFRHISVGGTRVCAGAGTPLNEMIGFAMEKGLSGLTPLWGIPGTVGGGLAMNAGAWGVEIEERVESVAVMNGNGRIRKTPREDLLFSYRTLDMSGGGIIVEAVFLMEQKEKEKIRQEMARYQKKRRENQPLQCPSAGSIFKNPPGASAGKIVEELGLKGKRIGGAEISKMHGNFIVNTGHARAMDVLDLIQLVQDRAFQEKGIVLELELKIVGE